MNKVKLWSILCLFGVIASAGQVNALPGQTVEEVTTWIQNHPTLQPASGETLMVRKTDTPARRFKFEALITSPGMATSGDRKDIIRTEEIALFDMTNGVSRERLEESLRIIYGNELYQDYVQARSVYQYPTPQLMSEAEERNLPLLEFTQGEVRQGDRFAYWIETVQTPNGVAYNGRISVFLIEDIDKVTVELQRR